MKYAILLGALLILIAIIMACTSKKKTTIQKALEKPIIQLSKSSCFGRCKVYNLTIYDNQQMVYKGIKNVEKIGSHSANISLEEYNKLVQSFKGSRFSDFETTYLSSLKDIQSMQITYVDHTVKFHKRKAPQELKQLMKQLDETIEKTSWKPIESN